MHIYLRGDVLQRSRLVSGLVLFAFAATHFANHALGLVSFEAMHYVQDLRISVTRSWPGTIVLAAALLTHITFGLYKLARRKTWRMPRWEALQIGLGLAIPFLLFPHIVNTRFAHSFFSVNDTYLYELARLWPDNAVLQSLLLLLVWGHGCIGLHYWLKLSETYRRFVPALLVVAIALPLLALAGFAVAGRATADIMSDPDALQALKVRSNWPNASDSATLANWRNVARIAFAALLASILALHLSRHFRRRHSRKLPLVTYAGGPTIELGDGMTVLEASRAAGVRHASVCGGRARCSTCRVRIDQGLATLPPASEAELITLSSIEAPDNVRLACQLRPSSSLTVSIISHPATPGPVRAEFVEVKEVVATHVRAVLADQLVDLASDDPAEVSRWFRGKVSAAPEVPDLSPHGFELAGGRLDYLLDRPAAALVYRRRQRPLTLFVLPDPLSDALAVRGQRNGYRVRAWGAEGLAYFAVSDLGAEELDRLEAALSVVATA
jgi:adenylate cyclase